MKYLKTISLGILGGAIFGIIVCLLTSFVLWDANILKQIFIPTRIAIGIGFVYSNIHYITE